MTTDLRKEPVVDGGDGRLNHDFLQEQVHGLQPYEFVLLASPTAPLDTIEIARDGDGALSVCVPPRQDGDPIEVAVRPRLAELGFASEAPANAGKPWRRAVRSEDESVDVAVDVLAKVFGNDVTSALDVAHGSHELEIEVARRIAGVRAWLDPILGAVADEPPDRDDDDDRVCIIDGIRVLVAVRGSPGPEILIRMIAITNGGVTVNPDLGLFVARLNQIQPFARFVLDVEHQLIWVDNALLGEHTDEAAVRFALSMVTSLAKQWNDSIKRMFGGIVQADMDEQARRAEKPDLGGYL
jgi:hypothetical protein